MKTKHTRGPWAWQKFGKEWCLTGQHGMRPIVLAVRKGGLTSLVNGLLVPLDPNHPDARLISAAPELLEALRELLSDHNDGLSFELTWGKARTALARATGDSKP